MFFDRCSFGGKLSTPTGVALSDSGSELGGRNGQANSRYVVRKKGYTRNPMIYHHFPVKRAVSGHSPLSDNPVWLVLHITYIQVCIYLSKYTPATVC